MIDFRIPELDDMLDSIESIWRPWNEWFPCRASTAGVVATSTDTPDQTPAEVLRAYLRTVTQQDYDYSDDVIQLMLEPTTEESLIEQTLRAKLFIAQIQNSELNEDLKVDILDAYLACHEAFGLAMSPGEMLLFMLDQGGKIEFPFQSVAWRVVNHVEKMKILDAMMICHIAEVLAACAVHSDIAQHIFDSEKLFTYKSDGLLKSLAHANPDVRQRILNSPELRHCLDEQPRPSQLRV